MRINAYIIRDYIRNLFVRSRILSERIARPLSSFEILDRQREFSKSKLYLSPAALPLEPGQIPEGTVLMLLGRPDEKLTAARLDLLWTEDPVSLPELINAVSDVFSRFCSWSEELQQCLYAEDPLQALGDCGLPYLHNPVGLYTRSFYILRYHESIKAPQYMFFQPEDRENYILEDSINQLVLDQEFLHSWDASGPTIYPDSNYNGRCLFQNIRVEGKYSLRLVVTEFDSPFRDSDFPILDYVVSFYEQLFKLRKDIRLHIHPQYLDESLMDCLLRRPLDPVRFQISLDSMRWKEDDTYFCCDILPVMDSRLGSLDAACVRLESNLANSVALVVQDHILLLCNLSRSGREKEDILAELRVFFRENIFKVAVGRDFSDLTKLGDFYLQAKRTLEIGQRWLPSQWFFNAEDHILTYILAQATQELPFELLCPQGLLALMEYDAANNRSYTNVLKVYLECNMHPAEAIRKLFMQRQTFLYQLERIKSISGLNLDNPETRLHLLIAYKLRELWERGGKTPPPT